MPDYEISPGGLMQYYSDSTSRTATQPHRWTFEFIRVECRHMDGRLASAVYTVAGQHWHIGPGGEEW